MLNPENASFLFTIFKAIEIALGFGGKKFIDGLSKPLVDSLEKKAAWFFGTDDETQRWEAFSKAFSEAKKQLLAESTNTKSTERVLTLLYRLESEPEVKGLEMLLLLLFN